MLYLCGMKIIIENLEEAEFSRLSDSLNMALTLWEFQQYLRAQVKYAETPDDINTIYKEWFENLNHFGIDLDKLLA